MKKLSVVVLVALLFSMVAYGEDLWEGETGAGPNEMIHPISDVLYVGIGKTNPSYPLDVVGTTRITGGVLQYGSVAQYNGNVLLGLGGSYKVGIGTSNLMYELNVDGTILAKEIIVAADSFPDFVFADNYQLMPLNKLAEHIKTNKSLPDIPTEKEVLEGGVKLGDMQTKLLKKVEELTLYVIELKKENEELRELISALNK